MKKFLVKKLNNKKAITLISLVVTIVILVILAAVAINMTIGNNGLFNKTKLAKEEYVNSSEKEKKDIDVVVNDIDVEVGSSARLEGSNIQTFTYTSPSTKGVLTKILDYPTGYNYNNTIILSGNIGYENTSRKYTISAGDSKEWSAFTCLDTDGIYMYIYNNVGFCSKPGEIVLMKK